MKPTKAFISNASYLLNIGLIFCWLLFAGNMNILKAQDIHFSQFYQCPANLNPGLTGAFKGDYRFIANQRTQWRSVTVPYNTFALSAEARALKLPDGVFNKRDGETMATNFNSGLSFLIDNAGDSHLKTSVLNISLSRDIDIEKITGARVVPAISIGYTGMRIDYSALDYDSQWNGLQFDPGLSSGEKFARSSRGYLNLNLGAIFIKTFNKYKEFQTGIGVFNIGNPPQSFYNDGYVKLDSRINIHGQYRFPITEKWLLEPKALIMFQGSYREFNVGSLGHFLITDNAWMARTFYGGIFGRANDAGYLVAGMEYDNWNVGLSYDINLSGLKPASNGKGGFEISVVYIVPPAPKVKPVKVCPDYM